MTLKLLEWDARDQVRGVKWKMHHYYLTKNSNGNYLHCSTNLDVEKMIRDISSGIYEKNLSIPDFKLGMTEKVQQFVAEENLQRKEKNGIQGSPIIGHHLCKSNLSHNDHMLCNNCKGSIMDVYRSCLNCLFKLCVTCCVEIRDGSPRANHRYPVHGETDGISEAASFSKDSSFMSRYPTNWISELLEKAEAVANVGKVTDAVEAFGVACSGSSHRSKVKNATLLAHQEDSNDNSLALPTISKILEY